MTKRKNQVVFVCEACGFTSPKWLGRCPACEGWSTLVEQVARGPGGRSRSVAGSAGDGPQPVPLSEVPLDSSPRMPTGIGEVDRVLGGGLVPGSLVLLGGDPGIGKSTLLLQATAALAAGRLGGSGPSALYVSGEESLEQTAGRAARVGAPGAGGSLLLLAETRLERILEHAARIRPAVLAIDSIQTMQCENLDAVPGSLGQVRECAGQLLAFAKERGVATILVGHVTKDGGLAGPKTLEHVVDAVVHFEGDAGHPYRVLRATKNRFGSTNELGVFEMQADGLAEVQNPSARFLAERPAGAPGSAVVACIEGSRPLLVEVQALVASASGVPRRAALGVDPNRVSLLLAVIARRAAFDVLDQDVFVNVVGGVRLGERAADLGMVAAVASSAAGRPVDPRTVCFGEVGLAGEVRAVSQTQLRLAEARTMGFERVVLAEADARRLRESGAAVEGVELRGIRDVSEALEALLVGRHS